jgi:hypothetical protein
MINKCPVSCPVSRLQMVVNKRDYLSRLFDQVPPFAQTRVLSFLVFTVWINSGKVEGTLFQFLLGAFECARLIVREPEKSKYLTIKLKKRLSFHS